MKEPYQWHPQQTASTPICQIFALMMENNQTGVWRKATGSDLQRLLEKRRERETRVQSHANGSRL